MATFKSGEVHQSTAFADQALALAWGAWSELGVSGWTQTHANWAVDPEPLIVFTAFLGDDDPRLRDEATDWCIQNWRYVSKSRLKAIIRDVPEADRPAVGEFTATVGAHTGIAWPAASEPRPYVPTSRSTLPSLDRASLVWIRLRAMFGVGARTEVIRHFLAQPDRRPGLTEIAQATSYTKRNIAEACDQLARAGVLTSRRTGNRLSYALARRAELEAFVGDLPGVRPDWGPVLRVTHELVQLERQAATSTGRTLPVKVRSTLDRIDHDLRDLRVAPVAGNVSGDALWPAVQALGASTLGCWAIGHWGTPPA